MIDVCPQSVLRRCFVEGEQKISSSKSKVNKKHLHRKVLYRFIIDPFLSVKYSESQSGIMASKDAISRVAKQIFGALPNKNVKTGNKALRQTLVGTYIAGYYPETIDKAAKLVG